MAVEAGADALGFVADMPSGKDKVISDARILELTEITPPPVASVLPTEAIAAHVKATGPTAVQIVAPIDPHDRRASRRSSRAFGEFRSCMSGPGGAGRDLQLWSARPRVPAGFGTARRIGAGTGRHGPRAWLDDQRPLRAGGGAAGVSCRRPDAGQRWLRNSRSSTDWSRPMLGRPERGPSRQLKVLRLHESGRPRRLRARRHMTPRRRTDKNRLSKGKCTAMIYVIMTSHEGCRDQAGFWARKIS